MKLTDIDLNDKSEVSAAHALLAAILGHAVSDDIPGAPSLNQTTAVMGQPQMTVTNRVGEISQTTTGNVQQLAQTGVIEQNPAAVFAQPGQLPAGAQPLQDPAAVFGGQSATPLPGVTALPATGVQGQASGLLSNGGTSVAPGAGGQPPQSFVTNEGAAQGLGLLASVGLAQAPAVELDSKGIPWDARIHASTKSKKKDGSWTALRGLNDDGKVKQIEAELHASVAASQGAQLGAIVQAQSATPLPGTTAVPQTMPPAQLPVTNGPASLGAVAQPGVSLPSADPATFEQLMPRVTQATISGILPPTALQQVCGALGLPSVVALQTNPAFVPHAWAQLKATYPALQ